MAKVWTDFADWGIKDSLRKMRKERMAQDTLDSQNRYKDAQLDMQQQEFSSRMDQYDDQMKMMQDKEIMEYGNIRDKNGNIIPPTVKINGETVKNPSLKDDVRVDVESGRYVSSSEVAQKEAMKQNVLSALMEFQQKNQLATQLEKKKAAESMVVNPETFDPQEGYATANPLTWLKFGFDEEEALDNLWAKKDDMSKMADMAKALDKDDPRRASIIASMLKLKDDLSGEKYASATAWYALDKKKYGGRRSSLIDLIDAKLKDLQ